MYDWQIENTNVTNSKDGTSDMSIISNLKPIGEIGVYLLISCALWFGWNYFNSAKLKHAISETQRDKLSDTSAHGTPPPELETDSTPVPPSAPKPEPLPTTVPEVPHSPPPQKNQDTVATPPPAQTPVLPQALLADDKLFDDIHYDIEEAERAILKGIGSKPYLIKVAKVRRNMGKSRRSGAARWCLAVGVVPAGRN